LQIEGTRVQADSFVARQPTLLSHYHADHMDGLDRVREDATIYCSKVTGDLLVHLSSVPRERVRTVEPADIFEPEPGVRVTALQSNHCAGALMFHVAAGGRRMLFTGDFRLNDEIRQQCAPLAGLDILYVDATYDQPHYRFPTQEEAVGQVLHLIRHTDARNINLAVYTIGKDRILQAIHDEFGQPFYVTPAKHAVCKVMGIGMLVTRDKAATRFRAYSRGYFENYYKMSREYRSRESMVIIPTGWAVDEDDRDPFYHYVPYSEHCDYAELMEFQALVGPKKVVPIS
jgi:putative mRNA 3-end processing factor